MILLILYFFEIEHVSMDETSLAAVCHYAFYYYDCQRHFTNIFALGIARSAAQFSPI